MESQRIVPRRLDRESSRRRIRKGKAVNRIVFVLLSLLMALPAMFPAGSVAAQDFGATPTFGELTLSTGFQPDPTYVNLTAGGSIYAGANSSCRGYIANAPDVRLYYTAGSLPLIISVDSTTDTTLVVNAPNGSWYCDDDSGEGSNPSLTFSSPLSGRYEIWIGTYSSGGYAAARLAISELYSH